MGWDFVLSCTGKTETLCPLSLSPFRARRYLCVQQLGWFIFVYLQLFHPLCFASLVHFRVSTVPENHDPIVSDSNLQGPLTGAASKLPFNTVRQIHRLATG